MEYDIYLNDVKEDNLLNFGDIILPPITHDMFVRKDVLDLRQIDGNVYKIKKYRELKDQNGNCYKKIIVLYEI